MKKYQINENDKKRSILYAVALQNHILTKMNIGPAKKQKPNLNKKNVKKRDFSCDKIKKIVDLSKNENEFGNSIDADSKEQINGIINEYNKKLTLAERLKIVDVPKLPLDLREWNNLILKNKKNQNMAEECAICLQAYRMETQSLLSCGHVFHAQCFDTFEKYSNCATCPLCRERFYGKINTEAGARFFLNRCAILIQKYTRKYLARRFFCEMLIERAHELIAPGLKRKRLIWRMQQINKKCFQKVRQNEKRVFQAIQNDRNLTKIMSLGEKEIYQTYIARYLERKQSETQNLTLDFDWTIIKNRFTERNEKECSICLTELNLKGCYILSCSHVFHANCINFLENHSGKFFGGCPLCRAISVRMEFKF